MLVSITSELRKLLASRTSYAYNMISTYVIGRLKIKTRYFLRTCLMSIEWTDQFCNRLGCGYMLLMKHIWLMNHESITNGIIYGLESMKIEPYIILIFFI
jgi:hypothetical protein